MRVWEVARRIRSVSRALAAPHPALWAATLVIAIVDALWLAAAGISLAPRGFVLVGAVTAILLAAAAFWAHVKPEPTLRAMTLSTASLLSFTVAVAVLHYLAAGLARPLVDGRLAAVEAALGFDWRAHVALLAAHPTLARGLAFAYHSSGLQVAVVVIALSALRRTARLWRFVRLFAVALMIVVVFSSAFPAEGPYAYYAGVRTGTEPLETAGATWHLDALDQLRRGAFATFALADLRGLATFPSFHVCLALITAWALAPIRIVGPLAIALNAAVIVGTIGAGGHYLPDILAGGALGVLLLAVSRAKVRGRINRFRAVATSAEAFGGGKPAFHSAARGPSTAGRPSAMRPG